MNSIIRQWGRLNRIEMKWLSVKYRLNSLYTPKLFNDDIDLESNQYDTLKEHVYSKIQLDFFKPVAN